MSFNPGVASDSRACCSVSLLIEIYRVFRFQSDQRCFLIYFIAILSHASSRKLVKKDLLVVLVKTMIAYCEKCFCIILWGLYGSISGHTKLSIFTKYIIHIEFWLHKLPWRIFGNIHWQHKNNIQIFYKKTRFIVSTLSSVLTTSGCFCVFWDSHLLVILFLEKSLRGVW